MREYFQSFMQALGRDSHRYMVLEINRQCNRRCLPCKVPYLYDAEKELTLAGTKRNIRWGRSQGFIPLTILGGEPFATYVTKEGMTFQEHTLDSVSFAKSIGMLVGVSTNADYLLKDTESKMTRIKKAGTDWLTLSFHDDTRRSWDNLVRVAQVAAAYSIVPIIHEVLTKDTIDGYPGRMLYATERGILVNATVVQEKDGAFSTKPEESQIPTFEQYQTVVKAMEYLKDWGFVRNDRKMLVKSLDYFPNQWSCDPERDYFIHIGAGGTIDPCEEVRSNLTIDDITGLKDPKWRDAKRKLIMGEPENGCNRCKCMYRCYYESENPDISGTIPTAGVMMLIRTGRANMVEKWGKFVAQRCRKSEPNVNWDMAFN